MQISEIDRSHVLQTARSAWESLRGKRLFLTGGTGFFGKWLLESFLAANRELGWNAEMVVLSRDPGRFLSQHPHFGGARGLSFVVGDIRDFAFPAGRFDYVLHGATAADAALIASDPVGTFETILGGTRRVLDFAAHSGARRLLNVSSGAVYGVQSTQTRFQREDEALPAALMHLPNAYAEGKRSAEYLANAFARTRGQELVTARCFAFVGPGLPLDAHFAIGNFIRDGLAGKAIVVRGDGTPLRSYLYAADLAAWLWTLLTRGHAGRAYNVGSDAVVSVRETAELTAQVLREDFAIGTRVEILGVADPDRAPERYLPSIDRARDELGLDVSVPLREALRRTIAWQLRR